MSERGKIIAILVAGMVAMALGIPMAMSDTATTSASVNNVAPTVTEVTVTPSSVTLNPCPNTTLIKVEASVSDDNGADDISKVEITALKDSNGNDASGNITETLPVSMTYNSSSGKYEATLNLTCTTPDGNYTVEVTATDSGELTGTNTGNFTVGITCALAIDFSSVNFGTINPGSSSNVTGDDNFSAGDGKPTIKNIGNVNIDVKQSITDNASNPEILFSGNTSSTVKEVTKTLTTTLQSFGISIAPGEATAADYELSVPAGTMHGDYAGTLTIEPVCPS
ncbi:MAG: hypothetical protein N2V74_03165 [Candidatus Methanospirare jalkutatii]|nr:MAG: hypothetical protein N2V74_02695 [Candidatus Methanospirare jalkutatii]UYZ40709.1 MAG: hypothetical protein N2V74_03165 [Candidatus Methanospirare jalkutatii]